MISHPAAEKSCFPKILSYFSSVQYVFFHEFHVSGSTLGNGDINRHSLFFLRLDCLVGKWDIQNIILIYYSYINKNAAWIKLYYLWKKLGFYFFLNFSTLLRFRVVYYCTITYHTWQKKCRIFKNLNQTLRRASNVMSSGYNIRLMNHRSVPLKPRIRYLLISWI